MCGRGESSVLPRSLYMWILRAASQEPPKPSDRRQPLAVKAWRQTAALVGLPRKTPTQIAKKSLPEFRLLISRYSLLPIPTKFL